MAQSNYFLAALLDQETSEIVTRYQLDSTLSEIQKNTVRENLHITVGYIGLIASEDLTSVVEVFKNLGPIMPIPAKLTGLGLYGGRGVYKTYFAIDVQDTEHKLEELRDLTDHLLQEKTKYSYGKNHWTPYRPHITIQRLKKSLTKSQLLHIQKVFKGQPFKPYSFLIKDFALWYKDFATGLYQAAAFLPKHENLTEG